VGYLLCCKILQRWSCRARRIGSRMDWGLRGGRFLGTPLRPTFWTEPRRGARAVLGPGPGPKFWFSPWRLLHKTKSWARWSRVCARALHFALAKAWAYGPILLNKHPVLKILSPTRAQPKPEVLGPDPVLGGALVMEKGEAVSIVRNLQRHFFTWSAF
jgi:hypothetical protein